MGWRQSSTVSDRAVPPGITTREVTFYSEGVTVVCDSCICPPAFSASSNVPRGHRGTGAGEPRHRSLHTPLLSHCADSSPWQSTIAAGARAARSSTWPIRCGGTIGCASRSTPQRSACAAGGCIPEAQVIDIRNAITYIQGEPGVDATRIGVLRSRAQRRARGGGGRQRRARQSRASPHSAVELGKGVERASFAPTRGAAGA